MPEKGKKEERKRGKHGNGMEERMKGAWKEGWLEIRRKGSGEGK